MKKARSTWTLGCLILIALAAGCASEHNSSQCNDCSQQAFTELDCARFAAAASCESWEFLEDEYEDSAGCSNGCSFKDCDDVPVSCESGSGPAVDAAAGASTSDAGGAGQDAASADACEGANGKFDSCDMCAGDCGMNNINGEMFFTCQCGATCPCGLSCGSIPLSVGGTLGNVCAP